MSSNHFNKELLGFLQQSPTPFHATSNMLAMLEAAGFHRLDEAEHWQLKEKTGYYVVRNDSALIAFTTGAGNLLDAGFRLAGTHTDSPCLKIKPTPEIHKQGYLQLGVEVYGGALLNPWFDRDLSIAGRVSFQNSKGELKAALLDFKEPIAFIPSLAIHLDRTANEERTVDKQKELPPVLLQLEDEEKFSLDELLLAELKKQADGKGARKILSHELLFYDTQAPALVGLRRQFIASARLDNLLSCFLACKALIQADTSQASVLVCNDHEEVGSASSSGAQGPFLKKVLQRVVAAFHDESDAVERILHRSTMMSIDNAHGVHPNYVEKHDEAHRPSLNGGPVIKINANQRYASNSESIALFKSLCDQEEIACQSFVMRSDMACGSTIGPITATEIGINTVDVGVASFGMHSIREMAGADDAEAMATVLTAFYNR